MRNNNKGNGLFEFLVIMFIVIFAFAIVLGLVVAFESTEEESKERTVESSEVVKETGRYMILVYKDDGSCDTLYSDYEGNIRTMGEFIFYESDGLDIVSKNTIIAIPVNKDECNDNKGEYDDMHKFDSGIDLDDY